MNIRQNNGVVNPLAEEQQMTPGLKLSHRLEEANGVALGTEFTFLLGSSFFTKFYQWVMKQQGTHLFTAALVLNVIKFIFAVINYYLSANKSLHEKSNLAYNAVQFGLPVVAIFGALLAGSAFVLVTPILFTISTGLDFLLNAGRLMWNTIRWGMLKYAMRGQDMSNPLIKAKYDHLNGIYKKNIKDHTIGTLISLLVAVGVVTGFLLPHAGAAAAAFAATAITLGALKTTVGGVFGLIAGAGILSGILNGFNAFQPIGNAIGKVYDKVIVPAANFIKKTGARVLKSITRLFKEDKPTESVDETQPLLNKSVQAPKVEFRNQRQIEVAFNAAQEVKHHGLLNQSNYRDVIINHIPTEEKGFAKAMLQRMVRAKIAHLQEEMGKGIFLTQAMQDKARVGKIAALNLVLKYLNRIPGNKEDKIKDEYGNTIKTVEGLVSYLLRAQPAVNDSFLQHESDTKNVLRAVIAYGRFEKEPQQEIQKEKMRI